MAGGHYKPEPLTKRGAALYDLGLSAPVDEHIPQHELSYLHAALILTYITDIYGEDKVWEFLRADPNPSKDQLLPIEDAIRLTFGISVEEFDRGFQGWLENNEPGEQLDDLRLTLALQDARREYQNRYLPDPLFLTAEIDTSAITRPEYQSVVMREAHSPPNIAVELMIENAQQAIVAADYMQAEHLIQSIKEVISTGVFEDPLAKEYLDITLAGSSAGYELVNLNILGDHAEGVAMIEPPNRIDLNFEKINGIWQIQS